MQQAATTIEQQQRHGDGHAHADSYFAHPLNAASQVLRRTHLVAPVTAVSIVAGCNRVLVGRGSELESRPLRFDEKSGCEDDRDVGKADKSRRDDKEGGSGGRSHECNSEGAENLQVYRHRAFAAPDGSGVIHGIRYAKRLRTKATAGNGLASKPSRTSNDTSSEGAKATSRQILPHWSRIMAVFGERKLALVYGGGIGQKESGDSDPITPLYFAPSAETSGGQDGSNSGYDTRYLRSCLTLSDLIYDVRLLIVPTNGDHPSNQSILAALGMAQNVVEIWHMLPHPKPSQGTIPSKIVLTPQRLRKVVCEIRCITYSLSLYGWGGGKWLSAEDGTCNTVQDVDLAVAVGTPSSIIYVWNALSNEEGETIIPDAAQDDGAELSIVTKCSSHALSGHDGVVFSCRFGGNGQIASTGDDRTLRLWQRDSADERDETGCKVSTSNYESAAQARAITDSCHQYKLIWTAYGHTARVWDCAFVPSLRMAVSCGEDSTVRMWDVANGGQSAATMKGFKCLNAWSIDVDDAKGIAIAGGNDGSAKIWHLKDQIILNSDGGDDPASSPEKLPGIISFLLPQDESIDENPIDVPEDEKDEQSESEQGQGGQKKRKKKKKKPKTKNSAQNVVGMAFYAHHEGARRLLVVARTGKMHSLDLTSQSWDKEMIWCDLDTHSMTIDPKTASCIGLRPNTNSTAIGMSRGDVVILSLFDDCRDEIHFSTTPHMALQAMKWVDKNNLLTLHVKGVVVWWRFSSGDDDETTPLPPQKVAILDMDTVGVPISTAYDSNNKRLAIGDSRSNVALFDMASIVSDQNSIEKLSPLHLIRTLHGREHVNDLIFSSDGSKLISGGNDGCIAECIISTNVGGSILMHKGISVPIPDLTGVMRLWQGPDGSLIAGGYQSNNYVMIDVAQGYQIMSVNTGGRQRSTVLDIQFGGVNNGGALTAHQLAICVGKTEGDTEFLVHSSGQFDNTKSANLYHGPNYYVGLSHHGEFVNGVSWIPTGDPDTTLLLSGSNDSSIKLACYREGNLLATKDLPAHVSCVRAVSSSSHEKSTSTLLITCGAKLITSFYLLEDASCCQGGNGDGRFDPKITKLCQNRIGNNVAMDHRMNAIKSTPLVGAVTSESGDLYHLVLAGDSDGGIHLFILSESLDQPRTIAARMLCTDSRPVLCIDIIRISDKVLVAVVGDTSGQVSLWLLPGDIQPLPRETPKADILADNFLSRDLPTSPFFTYKAHQCGTNCISALLEIGSPAAGKAYANPTLLICSGGDDEAISLWSGELSLQGDGSKLLSVDQKTFAYRNQASSSALKGIKMLGSETSGYRIYAAGYDQRLAFWSIEGISTYERDLVFKSSTPVDVSDINCLDATTVHTGVDKISIGGEGIETLIVDPRLSRAAAALRGANYILITVGAGMGADSGLSTYECMPEEYQELCDPSMLIKDTARFQSFWRSFSSAYSEAEPHSGYQILDRWMQGKLPNLCPSGTMSSCWVYSSNVDGHFRGYSSFADCLCEIHGFGCQWRCAEAIGRDQGSNRKGEIWEGWNANRLSHEFCSSATFSIDKEAASEGIACEHCGRPARPNVLLFHDTDENILRDIVWQRRRYQDWEAKVEDEVVNNGKALVILELGCGLNVPAVREESEEVFSDCLERIHASDLASSGSVALVRINPRDATISSQHNSQKGNSIPIYARAEEALNAIDALL